MKIDIDPRSLASEKAIVEAAQALRREAQDSELRFLYFLRKVEADFEPVWKAAGHEVFDTFLNSNALINSSRYRAFCHAVDVAGEDTVDVIGAEAALILARKKEPSSEVVRGFAQEGAAYRELHQGAAPSKQTAERWANRYEGGSTRNIGKVGRIAELEQQVRELRAENSKLRAEARELRRRLKIRNDSPAASS